MKQGHTKEALVKYARPSSTDRTGSSARKRARRRQSRSLDWTSWKRTFSNFRFGSGSVGARYVMEGGLRQAGTKLRLTVQLVDAVSGAHLWAETYERTFSPETVFELQDDL